MNIQCYKLVVSIHPGADRISRLFNVALFQEPCVVVKACKTTFVLLGNPVMLYLHKLYHFYDFIVCSVLSRFIIGLGFCVRISISCWRLCFWV